MIKYSRDVVDTLLRFASDNADHEAGLRLGVVRDAKWDDVQIQDGDYIVDKCVPDRHLSASIKEGNINARCSIAIREVVSKRGRSHVVRTEIGGCVECGWRLCVLRLQGY